MEVIDGGVEVSESLRAPTFVRVPPLALRAEILASMRLFEGLAWPDVEEAARWFEEVELTRGSRLTVQGHEASRVWLLLAGEALVSADVRPLRVIGRGEAAGVASMLYGVRSRETTIALKPVRALAAAPYGFAEVVRIDSIRRRLTALAGEHLRARRGGQPARTR